MINLNSEQINQARSTLENAKSILLAVPRLANTDKIAASLSLYLSLSAAGKQVSIVSPAEITVAYNNLIGVDKISSSMQATAGRNLVISFPYQEGSIEKVSYNIENDTFNLVIEPREGYPSVTPEMMQYSSQNGNYDCIVTVGCAQLTELQQLYTQNQKLFAEKPVINIDINAQNSNFGKINLVDPATSSISELSMGLINQMGLTIDADISTNLLAGLTAASENFSSPKTNAGTFEAAASLLKNGARKIQMSEPAAPNALPQFQRPDTRQEQPQTQRPQPPAFGKPRTPFSKPFQSQQPGFNRPKPQQQQPASPRPFMKPAQPPQQQPQPQQPRPSQANESGRPPETPPDWLKPKIYKGSTLL